MYYVRYFCAYKYGFVFKRYDTIKTAAYFGVQNRPHNYKEYFER